MGNYYLYCIANFLTHNLPLSVSYAVAVFLSDCQYMLSKSDREAVEANLKVILNTEKVPSYMVRDIFRNFGKYMVDFLIMDKRVNSAFIKDFVKVSNVEYFNDVLHKGKGGIIVSAHLGNWEMAGAILGSLGYPLSVVALAHKDDRVNKFFNSKREFFGATVIQTNVALRRCLEHLKRNRLIAILADRDFGHHGVTMDFLGRKAHIPQGAALFSLKTGAPIIPGFLMRTDEGGFQFFIAEPIYPPAMEEGKVTEAETVALVKKYLHLIEEKIRQYPSQWLMFRKFDIA